MSYAASPHWRTYQPFLPEQLRCDRQHQPVEELWAWNDHQVHLDRHVDHDAPAKMIALHGAGGNGRLLASVGIAAHPSAETVAPDLPGYGHTRLPDDTSTYTYTDWIACVEALVDAESARNDRPIILFGASIGGMLAYDVAARTPRVQGVIATCLLEPRDPEVRRAVVRHPTLAHGIPLALALGPLLGRVRVPIRLLANVRAIANTPELAAACLTDPLGGGNRVPLAFLTSWLRSQRPLPPEQFSTPVLLVHPGDDRWTPPALSQPFLRRIAGETTYVELDNCGHFPVEEPGLTTMTQAIHNFLEQITGKRLPPT